jgi:hypothetical protein
VDIFLFKEEILKDVVNVEFYVVLQAIQTFNKITKTKTNKNKNKKQKQKIK